MASIPKRRRLRSDSWDFFIPSDDRKSAKCKVCESETIIKTTNGSTTGLATHLKYRHNVSILSEGDVERGIYTIYNLLD